jgi:phosphoribosylglycinamide formyltransferase-1
MKKIVIFASGSGTNAENIIQYFKKTSSAAVVAVFTNNSKAGVITRVQKYNLPIEIFTKTQLFENEVLQKVQALQPDLIVLAGFLLQFPSNIINVYPNKIINIHPALLPKYGGKGMYGMHVHQAVLDNKELETGITIHYVNENYDEGAIIAQQSVALSAVDTVATIAEKIHELEQEFFPIIIERILNQSI